MQEGTHFQDKQETIHCFDSVPRHQAELHLYILSQAYYTAAQSNINLRKQIERFIQHILHCQNPMQCLG